MSEIKPRTIVAHFCRMAIALSLFVLAGCQSVLPKAQGLPSTLAVQAYDNVQAEVFWRDKSFAFLLSQEHRQDGWHIYALTLSGQVLFELGFDGKVLTVVQKHSSLSALPVEFLIRDIWWATQNADEIAAATEPLGFVLIDDGKGRRLVEDGKVRLSVTYEPTQTVIDNHLVPYRLIVSQLPQALLQ